ncbi:unnamed protein product [Rotaria socialis]|uniref:Uncharacterized protein n=1 Tax=Rotaria socialis TaxID=392032 RepID=A0A818ZM25_9BILA|nr:unnamed protein product [Rotaria socialis]CAF4651142.1 unnamed protein product [Rotaria socialis]
MTSYQQRACRYPNLLVTVKQETDERSVSEIHSKPHTTRSKKNYNSKFFYPTTTYYNRNVRCQQQQQQHNRYPSSYCVNQPHSQNNTRFYYRNHRQQQPPMRSLMELTDNKTSLYHDGNDNSMTFSNVTPREPKQRGQYRNRKAELDWDHAFDLDQIDLYTTQYDIDNHSLNSIHSSGDSLLLSV